MSYNPKQDKQQPGKQQQGDKTGTGGGAGRGGFGGQTDQTKTR